MKNNIYTIGLYGWIILFSGSWTVGFAKSETGTVKDANTGEGINQNEGYVGAENNVPPLETIKEEEPVAGSE